MFSWLLTIGQHVLPNGADASIETLRRVPFLGVLVMAVLLLATGVFVTNIFGQWWVKQWDRLLGRIPIVKSIYSSVKQVSDTLFSSSGNAFREAVLVQYPHPGSWTIAFVTGKPGGEVAGNLGRRACQPLCADHAQPHQRLLPDDGARQRAAAADERGRGAEVHHLDGRGGATAARAATAAAGAPPPEIDRAGRPRQQRLVLRALPRPHTRHHPIPNFPPGRAAPKLAPQPVAPTGASP